MKQMDPLPSPASPPPEQPSWLSRKWKLAILGLALFAALAFGLWHLVGQSTTFVIDENGQVIPRPKSEKIKKIIDNCKTAECKIITQGDLAACDKLGIKERVTSCRTTLLKNQALMKLDPKLCEQIASGSEQVACRSELYYRWALTNKNPGLCQHIEDTSLQAVCLAGFGQSPPTPAKE